MYDTPLAYMITFRTYASWLHGDSRGYVDRHHRTPGTPYRAPDASREARAARQMRGTPVVLGRAAREIVQATIAEVCQHRAWLLLAVNARTNHVHAVVAAGGSPERVLVDFKAWSTRRLTEAGWFERGEPLWSRHGSTRYLWQPDSVAVACDYVMNRQDEQDDNPGW